MSDSLKRADIDKAMRLLDDQIEDFRGGGLTNWMSNSSYQWVVQQGGRQYPVAALLGIAQRASPSSVPDGKRAATVLASLGFNVVKRGSRSKERLPASELLKVTAEHLWRATQRLA